MNHHECALATKDQNKSISYVQVFVSADTLSDFHPILAKLFRLILKFSSCAVHDVPSLCQLPPACNLANDLATANKDNNSDANKDNSEDRRRQQGEVTSLCENL